MPEVPSHVPVTPTNQLIVAGLARGMRANLVAPEVARHIARVMKWYGEDAPELYVETESHPHVFRVL